MSLDDIKGMELIKGGGQLRGKGSRTIGDAIQGSLDGECAMSVRHLA
jgi:hypothetical protein